MVKRRAVKKRPPPASELKIAQLENLLMFVRGQHKEYEDFLQTDLTRYTSQIHQLYTSKLMNIPDDIKKMTVAQYQEMLDAKARENLQMEPPKDANTIRSKYRNQILESEKKKTAKKEKKRSISANSSNRKPFIQTGSHAPRISRTCSEPDMYTPARKINKLSTLITPKFDPSNPMVKEFARKPKAGELMVSLSGSPLKNVADVPPTTKVPVSICNGKVAFLALTLEDVGDKEKKFLKDAEKPLEEIMSNIQKQLNILKT